MIEWLDARLIPYGSQWRAHCSSRLNGRYCSDGPATGMGSTQESAMADLRRVQALYDGWSQ